MYRVAAIGAVREAMVDQQRRMGETGSVLMDGRDIGTVEFPNAQLKIFLLLRLRSAPPLCGNGGQGQQVDLQQLQADIAERDKQDSERISVRCVRRRMHCFWIHPI